MKLRNIKMTAITLLIAMVFISCTSVKFEHNEPEYMKMQFAEVSDEFLASGFILDEEKHTLFGGRPLTVGEYIAYTMMAKTIDPEAFLTIEVKEGKDLNKLIVKRNKRGDVTLVATIDLVYQEGFLFSRVEKVRWEDKLTNETQELVTLEEKAGFAALIAAFLIIQ